MFEFTEVSRRLQRFKTLKCYLLTTVVVLKGFIVRKDCLQFSVGLSRFCSLPL